MVTLQLSLLACVTWCLAEGFSVSRRDGEGRAACHPGLPKRVALVYHGHYYRHFRALPHNLQTEPRDGSGIEAGDSELGEGEPELPFICSNYFETAENIRQMVIQPLEECGTEFITFFHSYRTVPRRPCHDDKLVAALAPYKHRFDPILLPRIVDSYIRGLRMAQKELSNLHIDTVFLLRFDVKYRQKITEASIDWNAVNLAHRGTRLMWDTERRVSDLFFLFPANYTKNVIRALDACSWFGHNMFQPLVDQIGNKSVHFVDPGFHASLTFEYSRTWLGINRACGEAPAACARES